MKTIYLAGGCFWGLEKYVGLVHGVVGTEVGYANGNRDTDGNADRDSWSPGLPRSSPARTGSRP